MEKEQTKARVPASDEIDVLVVGGVNTDFVVRGALLPKRGMTVEGDTFLEGPGGKGANQAVAAARLGARVAFLGRVGADERGKRLVAQLKAEGVDVQAVSIDPTTETGVALIMVEAGGEKQIMTAPGANHHLSAAEVMEASPLLARARVVLLQLELAPAATDAAARLARAAGARVVLDSAPPRALAEELLRDVHLVRANAAEAEVLTGLAIANRSTARAAAQNLLRRGVSAAVIGAPGGDLLLYEGGDLWVPHISVPAVDATGAGDAFSATLAVGLARGDDLRAVMRRASAAAALKTMKFGARAGLPTSTELEAFVHWAHSAENVVRAQ